MNQQVICEHLARVGLKTVIAQNGQIGVDKVKERIDKGTKQFDLIFMDMHMPIMDGLEAAVEINALQTGVPIVAMTANIMSNDRELYEMSGMSGYVGKPFTSQELWRCLMNYFKPLNWQTEDELQYRHAHNELQKKLIYRFVESNKNIYKKITDAIDSGDLKLAYRLVHTLKGNAGQLGKTLLQHAAEDVEINLKDGVNSVTPEQFIMLEMELNEVMAALAPMVKEPLFIVDTTEPEDTAAALELLDKIESLLKDDDSECTSYIEELHTIPGSEELIRLIDNFDFVPAIDALEALRKSFKNN